MKDNFSSQAHLYAQFRPGYPESLYEYIKSLSMERTCAWDCGTGSGQVASVLAQDWEQVYATDISSNQIEHAIRKDNIHYSIQSAEETNFPERFFDLIVVAQAIHWFDFDRFYSEVRRTAKEKCLLVVTGYSLLKLDNELDQVIDNFYREIIGPYWDPERQYIDQLYQSIPFPFEELKVPVFKSVYSWTFDQLIGYLSTWSAVKHYERKNGESPVELIKGKLQNAWGIADTHDVEFPILLKVGKVKT